MLAYKLLGADAEQYVVWSGDGASARPSISCPVEVLHKLERERKWIEAREWGLSNDLNLHEVLKEPRQNSRFSVFAIFCGISTQI